MKARYLTFFSYIGTGFRSSEKIWLKENRKLPDPESVQADGGVHALQSTAHFDLEKFGKEIYEPHNILYLMNKYFYLNNTGILVKKCIRVPDNFNARFNAISRRYLYRLAVLKGDRIIPENVTIASYIPVEEWKRCHFVRLPEFNVEKFKEAANFFVGYHDFSTFKRFDKLNQHKHNRRELLSVTIKPGKPLVTSHMECKDSAFEYWDVEFHGRAFVHNQIRRMMGTLLSVAAGKLQPEDVKLMLQIPSKHSWPSFLQSSPPDGLYLCEVIYNPKDLIFDTNSTSDSEKSQEILSE